MFDFLKKKVNSFTEKIKEKLEKKEELIVKETQPVEEPKEKVLEVLKEEKEIELQEELKEKQISSPPEETELEEDLTQEEKEILAEIKEEDAKKELEKQAQTKEIEKKEKTKEEKRKKEDKEKEQIQLEKQKLDEKKEAIKEFELEREKQIKEKAEEEVLEEKKEEEFEEEFEEELEKEIEEEKLEIESQKIDSDLLKERKLKAKVSLTSGIKKFFTGKVKIEEKDVKDFLEEFELALMESDVEQETAKRIVEGIKKELVGKEIDGKNVTESLKKEIALILEKLMDIPEIDLEQKMKEKKPLVILFLGPNGAGKTTSISKIAFKFKKQGKTVILAAADTFRAASIEQIEKHAERIGVRLVKHQYGSDPAAVAFDAVKAAEAKNADLVLIDSAGRQDTNVNLMNELRKIDRVAKPDLKLFVGEAMAGNSLFEQAKEFKEKIGFDGFILTKIDTDAKGGTAISLISGLQKPVVFVGTGQAYENLVKFTPKFITERIVK